MPNRRGQNLTVKDFNPKAEIQSGGPSVPRPMGEADNAVAGVMATLGDKLGRYADEQAQLEGARAGKLAGLEDSFRPTGDTTLRGRAFDQAATATYADRLETKLRESTWEAFKGWSELAPGEQTLAGLDERLGAAAKALEPDVFPEIKGEIDKRFSTLALAYRKSAFETIETRNRQVAHGALIEKVGSATTNAARLAYANPNDAAAIGAETAAGLKAIEEAEKAGTLTPPAAAKARIDLKRDTALAQVSAAAAKARTVAEVDALKTDLEKRFTQGGTGLDADGWERAQNELEGRRRALNAGVSHGMTLLKSQLHDLTENAAKGFDVPLSTLVTLRATEAGKTPEGERLLEVAARQVSVAKALKTRTPEEIEAAAAEARAQGGDPEVITFTEKLAKTAREQLATDPLGFYTRQGIVMARPIDFRRDDPAALVPQLHERKATAKAGAAQSNRGVTYFRPDEVDALTDVALTGGERALLTAEAIVRGLGPDAPAALGELRNKAPTLAHIGQLLASGAPSARQTARDVLEAARLRQVPDAKLPEPKADVGARVYNELAGDAFLYQGETQQRIRATARDLWQVRVGKRGLQPDSREAETLYREALQEAAGASDIGGVRYGGIDKYKPDGWWVTERKVPVPPNVRADRLADVIGALKDSDFDRPGEAGAAIARPVDAAGKPVPVAMLRKANLVYTSRGYRFAMGDPASKDPKFIASSMGGPFELDLQAFEPVLRPRVSGAYLGGQR